jgi:hypothetical protein
MLFTNSQQSRFARFLGTAAIALALVGCGGNGHSSPGGGSASASMQWYLYDIGDTAMAQPLACADVGATSVVITFQNASTGATYDGGTFTCTAYGATTAMVPPGTYNVTLDLYGTSNVLLDTISGTQAMYAGNNPMGSMDFLVNSFVLGWGITVGGAPTTCAAVGAYWVELDVKFSGQTQPVAYYFPCNDVSYREATLGIQIGPYTVSWQAYLLDASKNDLTYTSVQTYNVSASQQADLGTVYFPF